MNKIDIFFVVIKYHPRPNLVELGDRMTVALALFEHLTEGRTVVVRKNYLHVVKEFGCAEDMEVVTAFLTAFNVSFVNCLYPVVALRKISSDLRERKEILQISDIRTISAPSIAPVAAKLSRTYLDGREKFVRVESLVS
jgi:hypothetical protein